MTPNNRNCQKLRCRRSSIVEIWNTGRSIRSRICSRTAALIAAGSPAATRMLIPVFSVGSNGWARRQRRDRVAVALVVAEVRDHTDDGEPVRVCSLSRRKRRPIASSSPQSRFAMV